MLDQIKLTELLVNIVELQDPGAQEHSDGVAKLSAELSKRINMGDREREILQHASQLHDIGKIAINDSVIHKTSRLTRAEYFMIQQHTTLGHQLLKPMEMDAMITTAILSHHENFDGSGYPEGLKGDAIPLAARLIRIADFYDALTTYRPYRNITIYSPADALDMLRKNRHCFDPFLFDTFVEMIAEKQ